MSYARPAAHPTLTNLLEGRGRCSPDPVAVAAGINWCDELADFDPLGVHVIVPYALPSGDSNLERKLSAQSRPSIGAIDGTPLAPIPLTALLSNGHSDRGGEGWTLGQAADGVLLLSR